jgi:hypothetical protein
MASALLETGLPRQSAAALLDQAECSLMFVVSEQPTASTETTASSERESRNTDAGRDAAVQEAAR